MQCKIIILSDATIGYDSSRNPTVHCLKKPTSCGGSLQKIFDKSH